MRSKPEEARLAQAAANGDGTAFAQLYDSYERPIYNYCLRLLGNEHDAQDATQDAFVRVMRRLPEMDTGKLDFGPYLYTAARNVSYDMIEKRKRANPVDEIAEGVDLAFGDGPALDEDPVRSALLEADRDSIRAANSRLPARQREVLALREIEGMSYEDIADLMEMNANSVAQLISRARIRLRNELRGEAAGAVATSSPDCERALPLLARRQDGKLEDGEDQDWLYTHLAGCPTCPLAAEAMAEAGVSYRAWAPVVPAAWLFRDTLAKASEVVGADWSGIERPSRGEGDGTEAESADEGGRDGEGAEGGDAGATGSLGAAAAAVETGERKRRRRGLLVGSLTAALILGGLLATVVGGKNSPPAKTEPASTLAESSEQTTEPEATTAKEPKKKGKKKSGKPEPETTEQTRPSSDQRASTYVPITIKGSDEANEAPETRSDKRKPGRKTGGSGDWGDRSRPESTPTTPETTPETTPVDDPPTTTQEPTLPTDPPPTTTDPPPTDPKDPCNFRVC